MDVPSAPSAVDVCAGIESESELESELSLCLVQSCSGAGDSTAVLGLLLELDIRLLCPRVGRVTPSTDADNGLRVAARPYCRGRSLLTGADAGLVTSGDSGGADGDKSTLGGSTNLKWRTRLIDMRNQLVGRLVDASAASSVV